MKFKIGPLLEPGDYAFEWCDQLTAYLKAGAPDLDVSVTAEINTGIVGIIVAMDWDDALVLAGPAARLRLARLLNLRGIDRTAIGAMMQDGIRWL